MNQFDQNINKDMIDSDLIDVESLDFSDDQTWLCTVPGDSGQKVNIVEYNVSCDWPIEDEEYLKCERELYIILDDLLKNDVAVPDKHKFDSRTYVKPKKRMQRPSIQSIVEVSSNPPSISPHQSLNQSANQSSNKYLTYNKYNNPLGPISPMLRLKTFNLDTNTDNSHAVKEFAMKRRSLVQDDDPQLEDLEVTLAPDADASERLSSEHVPFKAINIDLSQPAHNIHNTFNRGMLNVMHESSSLNMYQSGESLMRMSPPSLVSSLVMESSGNFNAESLDSRKSISQKDSGLPSGRDSIDPMMTSMTLSILDEKDMSTSFLSQTTYPDNDSLMDSLPPSLVSSVNSSYVISNTSKPKADPDTNIFSSATFTHLEQSERLLTGRPRCQLYNSFTKRDSIKNSESYTKAREEACQIDTVKVLNENCDNTQSAPQLIKNSPKSKQNGEMSETITLHYSNNKFKRDSDAEKENLNSKFKCDDAFYKDMGVQKPEDTGKNSLNLTFDKQELNEIIQARQKLSLARKALPSEPDMPNQVDLSAIKTIKLPNQTIIVPKQSMENASELLSRRRALNYEKQEEDKPARETPKRTATFKKSSPKSSAMDATVVFLKTDDNNMIDINSATLNLIDSSTVQQEEWGLQERAMVGSSESTGTDTGTFSSSSPPESVPERSNDSCSTFTKGSQVASTPLMSFKKGSKTELINLDTTISPICDMIDDKSYLSKAQNISEMEKTYNMNATVINSATMVKKTAVKRDILAPKGSPEKKITAPVQVQRSPPRRISPTEPGLYGVMAPPSGVPRKTNLPTSKLRQYSSHRELNRIPGAVVPSASRVLAGRTMVRRGVYASNPALSPTAPAPPLAARPQRRDSYVLTVHRKEEESEKLERPTLTNPPALVRQGTETLRRERPQSQLVAPRDLRLSAVASGVPMSMRNTYAPPPTTRPYSIAGSSTMRVSRPTSVPLQKPATVSTPQVEQPRPSTGTEARFSALPRPSRLPAPRRTLRPPSVYSVAPPGEMDNY